jgi:crotonobetaine/carnitine-CoA ligase
MIDVVGERTLNDLLAERVALHSERPLLVFEDNAGVVTELSYGAFADRVARTATGLRELGVGHGDRVVVQLRNSPEILVAWFALARLGAIFVPSNTANTAYELEHYLRVAQPSLVVAEPDYRGVMAAAVAEVAPDVPMVLARGEVLEGEISFADLESCAPLTQPAEVRSEDVAELIFTSGTTSRPKAVMITHAHCLHAGENTVRCLWLQEGDRCFTSLPMFHVNAQAMTGLGALTVAGTIIMLESYSASHFWSQVRRHRATEIALVAMQLRTLLAQPVDPDELDHEVRCTFYSLNVPDEDRIAFEQRFGVTLVNGYGQSEAMVMITAAPIVGDRRWPSIGQPLAARTVYLLDNDGNEVAPGEVGEICIEGVPGRTIMLGYFNNPEATADAMRGGLLHTGDNATADPNGFLYFFDRKKDMIKRAGENISALEVESTLIAHPAISSAAVIGVPDPIRDEAVAAFVVATGEVTVEQVREHCSGRLARFKVPTIVEFVDELPVTSLGKVRKDHLRAEWLQRPSEA